MKTTSLSKALIALTVLATTFICSSCDNPEVLDDPKPEGPWVDQLMHYEAIEYDPDFKLLDYKYYVKVSSKQQVEELYAEMTDLDNYIPSYPYFESDNDINTVVIHTVREVLENHWSLEYDSVLHEATKQKIRNLLNTYPQTIELTWEYKGFQFKTIGILSVNTNLIVFEPVDYYQRRFYSRSTKAILPRTKSMAPETDVLKYSIEHHTDYNSYSGRISAGMIYTLYGQFVREDKLYKQIVSRKMKEQILNPDPNNYEVLIDCHDDPIVPGEHSSTSMAYVCAIGRVGQGLTANYVGENEGFQVLNALSSTTGYDHFTADLLEKDE